MRLSQEFRIPKEKKEVLQEIGRYVNELRTRSNMSLAQLSARLGVNPSYLWEVERGIKIPSDEFIRNLSQFYNLDENSIFESLGKVPLIAREELEENVLLQEILKQIGQAKFSPQKKVEIYRKFYQMIKQDLLLGS